MSPTPSKPLRRRYGIVDGARLLGLHGFTPLRRLRARRLARLIECFLLLRCPHDQNIRIHYTGTHLVLFDSFHSHASISSRFYRLFFYLKPALTECERIGRDPAEIEITVPLWNGDASTGDAHEAAWAPRLLALLYNHLTSRYATNDGAGRSTTRLPCRNRPLRALDPLTRQMWASHFSRLPSESLALWQRV
jgi:hypothetical protein